MGTGFDVVTSSVVIIIIIAITIINVPDKVRRPNKKGRKEIQK